MFYLEPMHAIINMIYKRRLFYKITGRFTYITLGNFFKKRNFVITLSWVGKDEIDWLKKQ